MRVIHLFRPSTLMRAASARVMPPIPPSPPTTQGLHRTRSERSSAFRCLRCYRTGGGEIYQEAESRIPMSGRAEHGKYIMDINTMKKRLSRPILIACDAIITRVQGPVGCHVRPDPCLEPEMLARCHVCRVGQRCTAPVTLPWCGHSGVNAAFCTLFNGYDGIHLAYAAYFGSFSTFQPALFNLG